MKKLYAPWRQGYVTKNRDLLEKHTAKKGCVFCFEFEQSHDEKNFILARFTSMVVLLNHYPYNAGHLMVLPSAHKAELSDLTSEESAELIKTTTFSIEVLKSVLKPQGFNVGINMGHAGGGGIPSHLHLHVLPRWEGDTNFLPLLCETKVISTDILEMYRMLKPHFNKAHI